MELPPNPSVSILSCGAGALARAEPPGSALQSTHNRSRRRRRPRSGGTAPRPDLFNELRAQDISLAPSPHPDERLGRLRKSPGRLKSALRGASRLLIARVAFANVRGLFQQPVSILSLKFATYFSCGAGVLARAEPPGSALQSTHNGSRRRRRPRSGGPPHVRTCSTNFGDRILV